MKTKIEVQHLERMACIYLRQSTIRQLHLNKESTQRQYELAIHAQELGWDKNRIKIFDQDLGKSGLISHNRHDFHKLIADVGLGKVGAVFALEASRFARSQVDWHRLVELCSLSDTLLIDADGIYNPNDFNDRMILGLKGTMSAVEIHSMKLRLQGGKLHKAKKGLLRCSIPIGYIYDEDKKLVLHPNEEKGEGVGKLRIEEVMVRMKFGYIHHIPNKRHFRR